LGGIVEVGSSSARSGGDKGGRATQVQPGPFSAPLRDDGRWCYADWNEVMAANLIVMIPVLLIYFFAQDKLIGGIANVGLKG